jgi:hypothetical protein
MRLPIWHPRGSEEGCYYFAGWWIPPWPKTSRGNVVEAGVGRPGHDGGGDLDQDHLDQELDACGEEVTGVTGG